MKRLFRKRINSILEKFKGREVLVSKNANFFGIESGGVTKIRGNGVLVLTNKVLFFGMWTPKKEFKIPIKNITRILKTKTHLHRSIARDLLKVEFFNREKKIDSAAWFVKNLDEWINKLEDLK